MATQAKANGALVASSRNPGSGKVDAAWLQTAIAGAGHETNIHAALRELAHLRAEKRLQSSALLAVAGVIENWREWVLEYDAANDSHGDGWDDVRIKLDRALVETRRTLELLAQ